MALTGDELRELGLGEEADDGWEALYKKRRHEGISSCSGAKHRATANHVFAAAGEEQMPYDSENRGLGVRKQRRFALMSVNEVHPIVSTMSGRQVMGRFERRYIPRRAELRDWAEDFSNWDRAVVDACHADQEESIAFRNGPCIGALSWIRVSVDYIEDEEGMIVIEEVPIWRMLWPAHEARKKNLLDRDWQIEGDWYPVEKFKALWPKKISAIRSKMATSPNWQMDSSKAGVSSRIPWEGQAGSSEGPMPFLDREQRSIWVERYEWREPQVRYFVSIPLQGSYEEAEAAIQQGQASAEQLYTVEEMSPQDYSAFVDEMGEVPPTRWIRKDKMIYRYAYLAGDVVLEEDEIPIQRWTYEAITGYPFTSQEKVEWRSVVDALRTPQIWTNIFLTMLVKMMQVNPKGVLFAERGVFRSRSEGLNQFASAGGYIEVERGKLQGQNPPFLFHQGGQSPMQGFAQSMLSLAQEMLPRSVGFNWAQLGQLGPDLRRISGAVVEHVRDAAVASHAELYDSFALCRQRTGLILLALLSKVLGIESMRRALGDEAFMEEVTDPTTGQVALQPREIPPNLIDDAVWKVSVEETKPAPDRTRFVWESLTESGGLKVLIDSQAMSPEELIEIIPDIPEDLRKRMKERIQQQMQMQAQQAQQGQLPPGQEQQVQ